ncbi:MAG TPA: hypothetical protein VLN59_14360 [Burkholderiales bacterium]|nr:hypothetical protein [Burkholderiales bacterium]
MSLPDPRRYGGAPPNRLAQLAANDGDAAALRVAVAESVAARRDDEIAQAYAAASSRTEYVRLWNAVCAAIDMPPADAQVVTRVFAMPWVMVCAGRLALTVPCVLQNMKALVDVLEKQGALGLSRNVGFSNALCSVESLEALTPGTNRAWATSDPGVRECPPAPIRVARGEETVHLRFLLGAAVTPVHEPGITETAANVALWGMQATRAMAKQLAMPGVEILPLPRPPAGIMSAAYTGRRAALETAFNLFLSNAVRSFRMKVGDPTLTVSSHEGNEVRVTLFSPLDEGAVEGYRWPLHPLDDLDEIEAAIAGFARDCRLPAIETVPWVLPDRTATGAIYYPRPDAVPRH